MLFFFFGIFLFYLNFFSSLLAQSDFHLLKPSLVIYIPLENNPFHLGSTFIAININTKCQLFIHIPRLTQLLRILKFSYSF